MSDYPGINKKTFSVVLSKEMFYNPAEKLRVLTKPKLTFWSKVKRLFGFKKNLTWTYKVDRL